MHVSNVGAVVGKLASGSHIRQIGIATLLVGASLIGYRYAVPGAGPAPTVSLPAPQPPVAQVVGSDSGTQAVDAGVAEQRARAAEIRRQGDQALHDGNWERARQLYAESDAILSGTQSPSAALAARRAQAAEIRNEAEDALRAAAVRQEGDMLMHEGRYDEAQALYAESNAIFSGKQFVSPAVAARRAQAAEIRQQGDQALHDGNWERAQQLYQESNAVFDGKSTK